MTFWAGLTAFAALAEPDIAAATIPIPVRVECPIGGRSFEFFTLAAYSIRGERPDGKPYGSGPFPFPLPECPDNGLVLYERDFAPAEIDRLRPLVASADYQALRSRDTSYYRAYWLMRRMGAPVGEQLSTLVQAIWETDRDPILRRRYLEELVERAPEIEAADASQRLALRVRAINALRELGRFDEAASMLRATRFATADGLDARAVRAWRRYYRRLGAAIARRDASLEPFDMIPRREAARLRRGRSLRRLSAGASKPFRACIVGR